MIKNFGYHEDINDELVMTANSVPDLQLPNIAINVSKDFKEDKLLLFTSCWADEKKPGIVLKLINKENPSIYGEIIIDEIEFADEIYDTAIKKRKTGMRSKKISQWIFQCLHEKILPRLIEQGYWFKARNGEWRNTLSE